MSISAVWKVAVMFQSEEEMGIKLDTSGKQWWHKYAVISLVISQIGILLITQESAAEELNETLSAVKRQSEAFQNRDIEKLLANMHDNFTAYRVVDDGPIAVIKSRQEAADRLGQTFGNSALLESEIAQQITVGEFVIQVELDTFKTETGERTVTTLAIYQVRDGKMFRAYNFRPSR